jgi:hypothetical protein
MKIAINLQFVALLVYRTLRTSDQRDGSE